MARRSLTSAANTADGASFTTDSISPRTDALVLIYVTSAGTAFAGTPPVPTITGNGLVWALVDSIVFGPGNSRRLSCLRALGPTTNGAVTIDFGGRTQDFCAWSLFEFDDVDISAPFGAAAVKQVVKTTATGTSLTAALAGGDAGNLAVGGIALDGPQGVTPGAGFVEIHEQVPTQFLGQGGALQTQDASTVVPNVRWTWSTAANAAAIVVEVESAPDPATTPPPTPPTNDERLIRRFEPILFLHPDEKFFPSDARRFVEHAALWSATAPYGDKNNWRRIVERKKLAAVRSEGGTFLGDNLSEGDDEARFLELGAWKDGDESAEPGVTAGSTNLYANRNAILDAYRGELAGSQFWYHAEVFHSERLRSLAGGPPNLRKTLESLGLAHPTLLCYYLFFPAHEQSVGKDECSSVDAVEVSCHAGDWQCLAILLDGDGSQDPARYTPKFFGHTGSRPAQVDVAGVPAYRPHQFDAEDRTVMKVERWRLTSGPAALLPEVNGEHPRLYVAKGSHSLYTKPGEHDVDPYPPEQNPRGCGGYDNPILAPGDTPGDPRSTWEYAALIAKSIIPIIGTIALLLETSLIDHPFGATGPGNDKPDPEQAPASPAGGIAVRPSDVSVPDAVGRVEVWRSRRNLVLGGRTYDFVVDRDSQVWWPHDDNERGFRGRWGQRVSTDPMSRRCGPKFPDYVDMFLRALEDGITRGFFPRP